MKKLSKNILIVVLARKNSKRIKNKNIRKINGKSLVYITLEFAKKLGLFNILVSTDSDKVKKIAKNFKKVLIHDRSKKYSGHTSKSLVLISKIVKWYNNKFNEKIRGVLLLQPTSPFRNKTIIIKTINDFVENNYRYNYISVSKTTTNSNLQMDKKNSNLKISKKLINFNFKVNGNFYIFNVSKIKKDVKETIINYKTKGVVLNSVKDSVDIDNYEDLIKARSF